MSIRIVPPPAASEADAPTVENEEAATSPEAPMIELLREDVADEGVNSWANSAAARVLARLREAHGAPPDDKRSGIFNSKLG